MNDTHIRAGPALTPAQFDQMRRNLCLQYSKWDPQVGDVGTIASFPLILRDATWRQLSIWAESLAGELLAAERELISSPPLLRLIGVPRRLRRAMQSTVDVPRIVRFDFHATTDGWRISEANADVPGGFNEGSILSGMMSNYLPGSRTAGDPQTAWADAILNINDPSAGVIALVSAAGFMEDAQVVAGLSRVLLHRGAKIIMCAPHNLVWDSNRRAKVWGLPISLIVRFVQAEWLPALTPQWEKWWSASFPIVNAPSTAVVESKRLPLAWEKLKSAMSTWRHLLPLTVDPREVDWKTDDWIVKPSYGNTGDDVGCIAWTRKADWRRIKRCVRFFPRSWVAQRRFEVIPINTPNREMFPLYRRVYDRRLRGRRIRSRGDCWSNY